MKHLWKCRRTYIATLAIILLFVLGYYSKDASVGMAIATVAVGLAGANAYEGKNSDRPS